MSYMHYIKLTRDAAVPMDAVIHRLTDEGHAMALRNTEFKYDQSNIFVRPRPEDREVVFETMIEEFTRAGWRYGSETTTAEEDPKRPTVSMVFRHPRTETRLGDKPITRPRLMGFEIPMPDPSVPITKDLIEYYAKQASDIVRGLMAQQVVDEEGKMPGTPGQGAGNPHFRPPQVRPLNEAFMPDEEDDGVW